MPSITKTFASRMTQPRDQSLRSVFLKSQILVSLAVLSIVTAILIVLLLSLVNVSEQRRILELARSIESQALIAKSPEHLQRSITRIVTSGQTQGIIVYNKSPKKVIAANSITTSDHSAGWLVSDEKLARAIKQALENGEFAIHAQKTGDRRIAVLPLGPDAMVTSTNVILGTKWPAPDWHKLIKKRQFSLNNLPQHIYEIFNPSDTHNFKLSPDQYSGAIIIETSRNWVRGLVLKAVLVIAGLMALAIFIVLFCLSRVLRKNIINPLKSYTKVIAARRAGDYKNRVPTSNLIEFDELAFQWNSLLDFRDVAQGQNMVLSTLLEHVPVGIDVTDTDGNIEYANPNFLTLTGFSLAEVIGKSPDELLTSNKTDRSVLGDSLVAVANGEPWSGEVTYARKDGSDLICNTTLVPIIGREDKLERLISVRHDITKLKEDQEVLITAKVNAETADRSKSEFLTNMSHELRTPLNAIIGFSELMSEQKLGPMGNEEYIEFSKLIETSSRTLLSSINLILDLSRLDAHRLQLNESNFCVSELLHKLIESKAPKAQSLGIEIKRHLSCKNDICTDQRMLYKVLGYILCNAIRYNKEGGYAAVSVHEEDENVIVTIKDTGIGISPENLPKVLEPFYRVDSALDRMKDGAGLGLALVKKFTEEQNIGFEMVSKLGKGTTVTLTFPVAKNAQSTETAPQALSA